MKISDTTVEQLLQQSGSVSTETLQKLKEEEKKTNHSLQDLLIKNQIVTDKDLTKWYAGFVDIPFIELDPPKVAREMLQKIPERIARQYTVALFGEENGLKLLAMEDPDDIQAVDFIRKYIGPKYKLFIATRENILLTLENYRENVASELDKVIEVQQDQDAAAEAEAASSDDAFDEQSPIAKTVNLLLEYAIRSGASDIHIEPREDHVQVRYRIDGVLNEANKLPKNVIYPLISRIKILSNLKIDERRVPQDGRFKVTVAGKQFAFRVSTLPITEGEKVVMRILNESSKAPTLEELGYWGWALEKINAAIVEPNGMILVTGPTGSGKSTSLFGVLSILNQPSVNISTVEDPVEYKIVGANQTQVNPVAGMTFVAGLRALLRQDPNIIMVGEIRDGETANLGVQAALTGHLVFSTLHTNNAATCLPRLLDMGIEPFLIASTVRAVVGQRLVRRLCPFCREKYRPGVEQTQQIAKVFGLSDASEYAKLHKLEAKAASENIGKEIKELSTTDTEITTLYKAHDEGCKECSGGYKGRMGIYEVLSNSVPIQKLITANATSTDLQDQAVVDGMITMQIDGFVKALRGQTSIEEILRVTRE